MASAFRSDGLANRAATFWLTAAALLVVLTLGGSNAQSPLVRLIGIGTCLILLGIAIYQVEWRRFYTEDRLLAWLLLGIILLFAIQLIPLPAATWTDLPGRERFAYGDQLMLGVSPNRPISLDPDATLANAVFLFAPFGAYMFLRTARDGVRLELFFVTFLVFATLSLMLTLVQALSGGVPDLYPGREPGSLAGLFSNRNHQATMLACAIPLSVVFIARFGLGAKLSRRIGLSETAATRLLWAGVFTACAIGALLTGSRTGSLLLLPAIGAGLAIGGAFRGLPRAVLLAIPLVVVAGLVALSFLPKMGGVLGLVFSRGVGGDEDRFSYWPAAYDAGMQFFPWGSGIGTFQRVFEMHEPTALLAPLRLNNAHSDWLELLIETGIFGPALAILFLIWFGWRSWVAWRNPDAMLAKAASAVIVLLLLHSLVDYPLRMTALAVLFAAAICALAASFPGASMLRNDGLKG